jgi:hypothetical protein
MVKSARAEAAVKVTKEATPPYVSVYNLNRARRHRTNRHDLLLSLRACEGGRLTHNSDDSVKGSSASAESSVTEGSRRGRRPPPGGGQA